MRQMFRTGFRILGILTLAAALAPAARADFEILVSEDGGPTIPIVDDGPLDTNTTTPGVIDVNTSALNALLTNFAFVNLGAGSNRLTGTPFSNDTASLASTGAVVRTSTAGAQTITITTFDTDYNFPSANPKTMTTSGSDTFRFTTAGGLRTLQSFFDPSNSTPPAAGVASPLLAFTPPTGTGPFSTSNPGVNTPLGTQPIPFGLSTTTTITLGPSTGLTNVQSDQFTGAVSITAAVPEPASVGLVALGLGLVGLGRLRRRAPRG